MVGKLNPVSSARITLYASQVEPALPTLDDPSAGPHRSWGYRAILSILLTASYAYLGLLGAVAVHEFIGHGLVALVVGGTFTGVQLNFDGMGWAWAAPPPDATWGQITTIKLGGVASTIALGLALMPLSVRFRRTPWLAIPLLVVAANLLLEGAPYMFWNAVHPAPPGDLCDLARANLSARIACIAFGGAVTVAAIWCVIGMALWTTEAWINDGRRLAGYVRLVTLLSFGLGSGAMWFIFDWDNLAPGLGQYPNIIGCALHLVAALSQLPTRWSIHAVRPSSTCAVISITIGLLTTGAATTIVAMWLRRGISW